MQDLFCPCCNGKKLKLEIQNLYSIYAKNSWEVVKCTNCTNLLTNPKPSAELLKNIYENEYLYSVHHLILNEKKFRARNLSKYIIKAFDSSQYESILEIGCMYGYLLDDLRNQYRVKGIEIGSEPVSYCKEKGLDVQDISIEKYLETTNESFDIIILVHVFEHLLEPNIILKKIVSRISGKGSIVITIPNSNSFSRKIFGRYWGWWQVPVHINHFNIDALSSLAKLNGLEIADIKYKGGDSLMLLLNFVNIFNFKNKNTEVVFLKKFIIKIFSFFFRYWYFIGNEELTVVLKKKKYE